MLNPARVTSTIKSSDAVPELPSVDVKSPETFMCVTGRPTVGAALLTTSTSTLQEAPGAKRPALRLTLLAPSVAFKMAAGPQSLLALPGEAIVKPDGKLSMNAMSSAAVAVGLVISNVKVLTLPGPMISEANVLSNVSCAKAD